MNIHEQNIQTCMYKTHDAVPLDFLLLKLMTTVFVQSSEPNFK